MADSMIAEVYPIQRLPRRFSVFDYLVPADLTLLPGSMVRVPFRHEELTGIVRRVGVKRVTMDRLKAVRALANAVQLAPEEIAWYEEVARETAQSVSSVLHAAFPPVPRRAKAAEPPPTHLASLTVKVSEAPRILQLLERVQRHRTAFVQAADLVQMAAVVAAYLHANARERVAVLVPHVRDARLLAPYLGFAGLSLMTGEESLGRRYAAWEGFRSRKTRVFLGTRIVSLLLPPGVETIFVLRSGHPDHKQADQNPRYDARGNARRYQAQSGCRLYFFDVVPRPDDLIAFGSDQVFVRHPAASAPVLVDLGRERAASPHPRVSYTLSQFLEEHFKAGMRTVCFYNRKGTARALRCHDCARTFPCPGCGSVLTVYETSVRCHSFAYAEPIPLSCEVFRGARRTEGRRRRVGRCRHRNVPFSGEPVGPVQEKPAHRWCGPARRRPAVPRTDVSRLGTGHPAVRGGGRHGRAPGRPVPRPNPRTGGLPALLPGPPFLLPVRRRNPKGLRISPVFATHDPHLPHRRPPPHPPRARRRRRGPPPNGGSARRPRLPYPRPRSPPVPRPLRPARSRGRRPHLPTAPAGSHRHR
ncbi:hypothetical protein HYS28_03860, partial [Candidatus Uhrbacteria bacterium]|nr:hypothetical protein [Candidatus Uhrbacteria bacterium]